MQNLRPCGWCIYASFHRNWEERAKTDLGFHLVEKQKQLRFAFDRK